MTVAVETSAATPSDAGRRPLAEVVPFDVMRAVRLTLMAIYLVGYLWWLRNRGLPIDRISVAISLAIFLVCAFIGRPLRTWAVLLLDVVLYCVMWFCLRDDPRRGRPPRDAAAGRVDAQHRPLPVLRPRPERRAAGALLEPTVRWYDWVASSSYMTHFVSPVIAMAVLWATTHRQWVRFMKRFATVLGRRLRDVRRCCRRRRRGWCRRSRTS